MFVVCWLLMVVCCLVCVVCVCCLCVVWCVGVLLFVFRVLVFSGWRVGASRLVYRVCLLFVVR